MKTLLWIIATLFILVWLLLFVIPYFKRIFNYLRVFFILKRVAKNYDEETRKEIDDISKDVIQAIKEEKL